jgi:hypothetical protein
MINEWAEVDVELFKEIFNTYLNHEGSTAEKVIEIQNISSIILGANSRDECRIFIGAGLDPLEWKEDNRAVYEMYKRFLDIGLEDKIKNDLSILNICYFQDGSPMISPIGASKSNIDLFLDTCFGNKDDIKKNPLYLAIKDLDQTVVWYRRRSDGKINYVSSRPNIPDRDKLVRIRTMDLSDWKKMMLEGSTVGRFPEKYRADDIKKDDIFRVG